jgi:Tol biopolymer transport system component/DNA-binding winged helix-turn-helix (wHTH) protein
VTILPGSKPVIQSAIYEFGDVRVDTGRITVTRTGEPIPLEPKAFDLLVHLIENRDRLLTKDELLERLWPGTFVTPNVLTRAMAHLRKGLGDDAHEARYIETFAKRGYRFIAPVSVAGNQTAAAVLPSGLPPPGSVRTPLFRPQTRRSFVLIAALILGAAAATATLVWTRAPVSKDAGSPPIRRLTTRSGYNAAPSLAPDGRAVVYVSDATGNLELYLAGLASGSAEVALTKDGGQNTQPAWSPDGQWIAYHSRKRGGIWIVQSTGGVPQQVVEFGSDPAWSPRGDELVFTSDAGGIATQSVLWLVRRDGTGRRALTHFGQPSGAHRAPSWSHDGRRIVFVAAQGGWTNEIWTLDVPEVAMRRVAVAPGGADPAFAPDDRSILWGGTSPEGNGRLWRHAIAADGTPRGSEEVVVPLDAGIVNGVSVSAEGAIAFGLATDDSNLWAVDFGPDGAVLEPRRLSDDVVRNTNPDYSRDGRIAYVQTSVGSPPSVWLMREDGTGRAPLVAGLEAWDPQWQSDASRLLVVRGPMTSRSLAWVDAATRLVTPIELEIDDVRHPRMSPDGRELAFHVLAPDGVINVWTQRLDGPRIRLTSDPEAVAYPEWSPDGLSIAVEVKRGDQTFIGVVARDGGPVTQLTFERGQSWPHSWAPDNDRIAFAGEREGVWNVYTVSRRTRAVTALTRFKSPSGYVRFPAWSPRGERVVFERSLRTGGVWTLTLPEE